MVSAGRVEILRPRPSSWGEYLSLWTLYWKKGWFNHVADPPQGFVQFDLGDIEDSGKTGAVSRREKAPRDQRRRAPLTGQAGRDLFLESLQLIIRSQLTWLINEKGHREELETVVRDLWDLRIRGSNSGLGDDTHEEEELEIFSSEPPQDSALANWQRQSRKQSWDPELGSRWPLPRVPDTLAICYLGCVLLRIPTHLGEITRWANNGSLLYKKCVSKVDCIYIFPIADQKVVPLFTPRNAR